MTIVSRATLQAEAATIRDETAISANTATRVGGALKDLADSSAFPSEGGALIVPHDTTFSPVGLWQLAGSLTDTGSGATSLTLNSLAEYTEIWPGFMGLDGLGGGFTSTSVSPAALRLTGDMTIEAIVRNSDYARQLASARDLLTFGVGGGGTLASNCLYSVGINVSGFPMWTSQHGSNVTDQYVLAGNIYPSGLFHLAVTRTSNVIQFYVNGLPFGAASGALTAPTGGTTASFAFGPGTTGSFFSIGIASVKIVASALTAAQVKTEYNRTLGPVFGLRP